MSLRDALLAHLARTPEEGLEWAVKARKTIYDQWWELQQDIDVLAESPPDAALCLDAMRLQAEIAQGYHWPAREDS